MSEPLKTIRIGAGAGFAGDRIEPAVDLVERGGLDYIVFECLAERTIALAHLREQSGSEPGFDPMLEERMRAVLPAAHRNRVCIISNMGAANPRAAARATVALARELGLQGLRVAYVEGDDVLPQARHFTSFDGESLPAGALLSANVYLGAQPIVDALTFGADVVLTGRVADPSLFLGALRYSFGWREDEWAMLGQGTAIGHLLECAGQLTGGYFADPGYKDVPQLASLGFPFADVSADGSAVLRKLEGTGGLLSLRTCREQLLYEVMDPAAYATPDVTADFTTIRLEAVGIDSVRVSAAGGRERPLLYKVSVGVPQGYLGEGQISYAGGGAVDRARLAAAVLKERLKPLKPSETRFDLIGLDSIHGGATPVGHQPYEVRVRAIGRFATAAEAHKATREIESLYVNGPSGGCGITTSVRQSISIVPTLLAREFVQATVSMEVA